MELANLPKHSALLIPKKDVLTRLWLGSKPDEKRERQRRKTTKTLVSAMLCCCSWGGKT
jgi:hypothetical protein